MQTNIDKTQLIEEITTNIKQRMDEINTLFKGIKVYDKNHVEDGLKEKYDSIYAAIKDFEEYIKSTAFETTGVDSNNREAIKKQVYERFFSSSAPPFHLELLTYESLLKEKKPEDAEKPDEVDYDLLLACARRANQQVNKEGQRLLFLCNLDFIQSELIDNQVKIENVNNLGILHHYAPLKFTLDADKKPVFDSPNNVPFTEQLVSKVFDIIPKFIKNNIQSDKLKVVLRSCSGAQTGEKNTYSSLDTLSETKSYPIKLLPPHTEIVQMAIKSFKVYPEPKNDQKGSEVVKNVEWCRENEFKRARETNEANKREENICIRQDYKGDEVETLLYFPFKEEGIPLEDFPMLKTKEDFKLFAEKLKEFLGNYEGRPIHINHFSINTVIRVEAYVKADKNIILPGLQLFKNEFTGAVKKWESKVALESNESKLPLKQWLTAAKDLHDVVPLHEKSYAAQLLSTIRDDCPNVSVFKAYYGGYRAAPDRTIRDVAKTDINEPKAIVMSRDRFWKVEQPKKAPSSPSDDATPSDDNKLTS